MREAPAVSRQASREGDEGNQYRPLHVVCAEALRCAAGDGEGRSATLSSGQGLNQAGYTSCWLRAVGSHHIKRAVTNQAAPDHFSIAVMNLPPVARGYLVPSADFLGPPLPRPAETVPQRLQITRTRKSLQFTAGQLPVNI